jgi:hypothetical protein
MHDPRSAWHESDYDRCDTIKDSPYFKGVMSGKIPATADEKLALKNSEIFYQTPAYTCQVDRNTLNQVVECQREDWHYNQGCQYNNFHKI